MDEPDYSPKPGTTYKGQCFCPSRLKCARQRRGMTVKEIAGKLEVTSRKYRALESENPYPEPLCETVRRLALILAWPLDWFYQDELELLTASHISWVSGSQSFEEEMTQVLEVPNAIPNQ